MSASPYAQPSDVFQQLQNVYAGKPEEVKAFQQQITSDPAVKQLEETVNKNYGMQRIGNTNYVDTSEGRFFFDGQEWVKGTPFGIDFYTFDKALGSPIKKFAEYFGKSFIEPFTTGVLQPIETFFGKMSEYLLIIAVIAVVFLLVVVLK